MKPGFFDGAPSFNGINVLDVYKVENKPLLERFQSCAAMLEPGKVKGLFTSVPAKAVERTVVLGFGPLDHDAPYKRPKIIDEDEDDVLNGKGTDGKSLADKAMAKLKPRKEDIFRRSWFAFHDKGDGYAEKIVDQASIATFPRTFSRYSTVEVDRFHIHESHRLKSNPGLATEENKESKMAKERWEKSTDGGGPVSDEIRYLIFSIYYFLFALDFLNAFRSHLHLNLYGLFSYEAYFYNSQLYCVYHLLYKSICRQYFQILILIVFHL